MTAPKCGYCSRLIPRRPKESERAHARRRFCNATCSKKGSTFGKPMSFDGRRWEK